MPVIEAMIPNAYGFTDIANRFVSAAQIVVSALNTMASRFITIRIHRNEKEEAGQYFSSVFFANVIMAAVFMIPALFVIVYLGRIFQIPAGASLPDIQMLFFFIFLNFTISIITSVFSVACYSKDRLELSSVSTILGEVVRLTVLAVCYICFRPYLFYVGCASVASTVVQAAANMIFTRKLLPEMKLKIRDFRWKKVGELVSLGAWNSVTRLGQLLLDGLNTSIANIMISAAAMTTVSISNQVPTVISNLMGTIAGVFNPQMTIAYAKEDKNQLLDIIASADRIMIFIISIPIAFMTVFGKSFFCALGSHPGRGCRVYPGYAECGYPFCQRQYSGSVSCVSDHQAGQAEFCGDCAQRSSDGSYGIRAAENHEPGNVRNRGSQHRLRRAAESDFYAVIRGEVPESEMAYFLWRYCAGPGVYRRDLPCGASL